MKLQQEGLKHRGKEKQIDLRKMKKERQKGKIKI